MNTASLTQKVALCTTLLVFGSIHLLIVLANHYYFRTYAYDYGVYNFAFYDFAHLRVSPCPIYMSTFPITFLQDHFSLLLPLLSPLYWVTSWWAGTYSLLIIQWVLIMLGGWYTYKLVELKSQNFYIAWLSLIFYMIIFGRFSTYTSDCNLVVMASAFVPPFIYFFETRKRAATIILFVVLLICREDFSLWLLFFGLFLSVQHRRDKSLSRFALFLSIVSLLFFVLIFVIILPSLETEEKKFSLFNYTALGPDPGKAFTFLVSHPVDSFELLFSNHSGNPEHDWKKTSFYLVYFFSGGFLLFFRPTFLIPFIPLVAKKMFNDNPVRWGTEIYYSVEVATILPFMVFWIISEFKNRALSYVIASNICVMTLAITLFRAYQTERSKYNFMDPDFYTSVYPVDETHELARKIEEQGSVCASSLLLPHLAYRREIFHFPMRATAGYIFIAKSGSTYPLFPEDYEKQVQLIKSDTLWTLMADKDNILVFKKIAP